MKHAITNGRIFTGEKVIEDKVIIIENGFITAIQNELPADATITDLDGKNISTGFLDIQINGGQKFYFSQQPTEETLHDICDSSLLYGTTFTLPCLISSSHENILKAIETVGSFMQKHGKGVLGMHLEGPFINPKKRGAHVASIIRKPTDTELEEIVKVGKGIIKVMTVAPECFTDDQLEMLMDNDIVLSAGHSDMDYDQAQYYFSKGISLVTHLYNAMNQMGHRSPGLVGAALNNSNVYTPIILDGAHCHYAAARIAQKIKKEKCFLISDAAFLGRAVNDFKWGEFNATLIDGFYRNNEGTLAGAAISMAEAVQNAVKYLDVSLEEAIKMATVNAANAINMQHKVGCIKQDYPASFVTFNNDFSKYETLIF
ncbi:MAG: N-acetylglucosamine-6-phosphate deacetylase [Ferruginibacter sp.]